MEIDRIGKQIHESNGFAVTGIESNVAQGNCWPSQVNSNTGPPITTQPMSQGGVPASGGKPISHTVPNCPPGLEYLTMVDQLIINREINLKDTIPGWVSKNKYVIGNCREERVYYAAEVSECCGRNCCGTKRAFEIKILDNFGEEVMRMNRPLACQSCYCPCCLQNIEVYAPPGTIVGVIEQQWSLFCPTFVIKNSNGGIVLLIKGSFWDVNCCCSCTNTNFIILSADGKTELGKVYKKYLGCCIQRHTDENVFGVEFPIDLDVNVKASLLAACFLIEMMYFEAAGNDRNIPSYYYCCVFQC